MSFENYLCYFCDNIYPYPSCFISSHNGMWICESCEMVIQINNNEQNEECCVCLEYKTLIKLPTCSHKVCFSCCKTIYFGSTKNERPIHWREMTIESPDWPYELNDDKNTPEYIKFEDKYFDTETKSYDELIMIRNNLMSERPEWMNDEKIINYEDKKFRYHTEFTKIEKEFDEYNNKKTKGNESCPLCRAKIK